MYTDNEYDPYIPDYILYDTAPSGEKFKIGDVPEYPEDEKVDHVRKLIRNNYFVGMRVNSIHDTMEGTSDTIYQDIV